MPTLNRPPHELPPVQDLLLFTRQLTQVHLTTVVRLAWSTGALLYSVGRKAVRWARTRPCGVPTEPHLVVDATREQLAALVHDTHAELLITAWSDLPALDGPVLLLPAQVRS